MLVRKTEPFPISACAGKTVRLRLEGIPAERFCVRRQAAVRTPQMERLPEHIFTPATKASTGHDINISEDEEGCDTSSAARPSKPCAR